MAYFAVKVMELHNSSEPFKRVATDEEGHFIEDEFDHGLDQKYMVRSLFLDRKRTKDTKREDIVRAEEIKIDMIVTDCRVIFRCDNYDKGDSTWRGGGLSSVALNAYERTKGKIRSAGKSLIGHVRYEWLLGIGYIAKLRSGFFHPAQYGLQFAYLDKNDSIYYLQVYFKRETDTAEIANDILHRAAKYRMAMQDEKTEEELTFFNQYAEKLIEPSEKSDDFSNVKFPNVYSAPGGKEYRPASSLQSETITTNQKDGQGLDLENFVQNTEQVSIDNIDVVADDLINELNQTSAPAAAPAKEGSMSNEAIPSEYHADVSQASKPAVCPNCGVKIKEGARFCSNCGSRVD